MSIYYGRKNSIKIFIAITLGVAAILIASLYLIDGKGKVVIAKVNDTKIYKSDVENKLRSVFNGQVKEVKIPEVETLPKEVLELLVKEVYIEQNLTEIAKKSKLTKTEEAKEKIREVKDRTIRQIYFDSLVKQEITDERVNEKYTEVLSEISGKKEYLISHIVSRTQKEAEKILKELKAKKFSARTFAELAKKYSVDTASASNGGSLGYLVEGSMVKEIAEAIPTLKKDMVSEPIQTKFGWHLVKFSDIREVNPVAFEDAKEGIRNQLIRDKFNEINSSFIKDAKITILIEPKDKPEQQEAIGTEESAPETSNVAAPVDSGNESANNPEEQPAANQNAEPDSSQIELTNEDDNEKPVEAPKKKHSKSGKHR